MQCRASNPLARRIEGWSPKTCLGRPARKTRRTKVMKMKGSEGGKHQQVTWKAVRKLKAIRSFRNSRCIIASPTQKRPRLLIDVLAVLPSIRPSKNIMRPLNLSASLTLKVLSVSTLSKAAVSSKPLSAVWQMLMIPR